MSRTADAEEPYSDAADNCGDLLDNDGNASGSGNGASDSGDDYPREPDAARTQGQLCLSPGEEMARRQSIARDQAVVVDHMRVAVNCSPPGGDGGTSGVHPVHADSETKEASARNDTRIENAHPLPAFGHTPTPIVIDDDSDRDVVLISSDSDDSSDKNSDNIKAASNICSISSSSESECDEDMLFWRQ